MRDAFAAVFLPKYPEYTENCSKLKDEEEEEKKKEKRKKKKKIKTIEKNNKYKDVVADTPWYMPSQK